MRRSLTAAVASLALAAAPLVASPAQAGDSQEVIADGLVSPLSMAVAPDGTVYVAQNFAGMLTQVAPGGKQTTVYTDPHRSEVGAVSVAGDQVVFATTGGTRKHPTARLHLMTPGSKAKTLANLYGYEKRHNPDAKQKYGLMGLSKRCKHKVPRQALPYRGIVESHPYATAVRRNRTYVADAAGNAILRVGRKGRVHTVAVLPPTRVKITRKAKRAMHLPGCTVGKILRVEPVPTDVEIGPDGNLYVTSLPGGPEEPALGANGRVYRVNPADGSVHNMGGGLTSPVGLALTPTGDAYISMLFASTILKKPLVGSPSGFASVDFPGDVEYSNGYLYATATDLMNDGQSAPAGQVLRWAIAPPS